MSRDWKRGKFYRLYTLSSTLSSGMGMDREGPFVMYAAIPRLMPMPTTVELEIMLSKYGYGKMDPSLTSVSYLGDFRYDDLPQRGCLLLERDGVSEAEAPEPAEQAIEDKRPIMIRMDWRV